MQQLYYEIRNLPSQQQPIAADIARHLQMRQYLGTAIVLCDNPTALLSAVRKQWLKSCRALQRQRASTLNPEEILRLTHSIMHMQNMQFTVRQPADAPDASVYFLDPNTTTHTPMRCFTIYTTTNTPSETYHRLMASAPQSALFAVFSPHTLPAETSIMPKSTLEAHMLEYWQAVRDVFTSVGLDPNNLVVGGKLQFAAMDDALDTLLNISGKFLTLAAELQHLINLSQPLTLVKSDELKIFAAVIRLAHRVQALTPGTFNTYLTKNFGQIGSDAFFLQDAGAELHNDLEHASRSLLHNSFGA